MASGQRICRFCFEINIQCARKSSVASILVRLQVPRQTHMRRVCGDIVAKFVRNGFAENRLTMRRLARWRFVRRFAAAPCACAKELGEEVYGDARAREPHHTVKKPVLRSSHFFSSARSALFINGIMENCTRLKNECGSVWTVAFHFHVNLSQFVCFTFSLYRRPY